MKKRLMPLISFVIIIQAFAVHASDNIKDNWCYCPDLNLKTSANTNIVIPFDPIHFKLMKHAGRATEYLDERKESNYATAHITFVVSNCTENSSDIEQLIYSISSFLTTNFLEEDESKTDKKIVFL